MTSWFRANSVNFHSLKNEIDLLTGQIGELAPDSASARGFQSGNTARHTFLEQECAVSRQKLRRDLGPVRK